MASFKCPFCKEVFSTDDNLHHQHFDIAFLKEFSSQPIRDSEFNFRIKLFRCPSCEKISTIATGVGTAVHELTVPIYPASFAVQFPEYVPVQIRSDYEEAYAILSISPKASATLSRRCLQGMIHDFWDIHEKNLNAEITALKPHISASQWKALDGLRRIGNIGAHMERDVNCIIDVDPEEAENLLKLIQLLIGKWYINRHEEEALYADIVAAADEKTEAKKSHPSP